SPKSHVDAGSARPDLHRPSLSHEAARTAPAEHSWRVPAAVGCGILAVAPGIMRSMPAARSQTHTRPTTMAVWLVIAGAVGWWAAFQLTLEKFHALEYPGTSASCDFSVLVQCTA